MHQVMIHPASYDTVRAAIDRAFDLFPREPGRQEGLDQAQRAAGIGRRRRHRHPSGRAGRGGGQGGNHGTGFDYRGRQSRPFSATAPTKRLSSRPVSWPPPAATIATSASMPSLPFHPDFMEAVNVSRAIIEADIVISLPKFKTHGLTVVTGAIKNSYGILPGAQKARLHKIAGNPARFHDLVVEVFRLRVPDLFIVDAVVGMEGNGPASPDLREIGLILAADNAVAMDAVMAAMMGLDPGRLRFLTTSRRSRSGHLEHGRRSASTAIWCPWMISSCRHWAARPSRTMRRFRKCWRAKPGSRPGRTRTAARPAVPVWSSARPRRSVHAG
jgi:hypothetical protein